jgi:hypothetical protein
MRYIVGFVLAAVVVPMNDASPAPGVICQARTRYDISFRSSRRGITCVAHTDAGLAMLKRMLPHDDDTVVWAGWAVTIDPPRYSQIKEEAAECGLRVNW